MTQSPYAFEIRFGGAAIECGVVAIPRVVVDHYVHLGLKDAEMAWIVHLLAYKWTADDPYPKRSRLRCSANEDTQRRYAHHMRELGLLFTYRRYYAGRVICLGYDFNSLVHNSVRMHDLLENAVDEYVMAEYDNLTPGSREYSSAQDDARGLVLAGMVATYEVELPADVLTNLKAGKYDDVPAPWSTLEETPLPAQAGPPTGEDPAPPPTDGEAELESFFGPRPPADLDTKADKGNGKHRNSAIPVQAGGGDSPAEAIVDGICRYNGLTDGIEALPRKKRTSWVRQVAEILESWGGATEEEARLSWQAFAEQYSWRTNHNPFYRTFGSEIGPLLVAARKGESVTEESRQRESDYGAFFERYGGQDKYLRKCQDAQAQFNADAEDREVPPFWKTALDELHLQMDEVIFDTHLRDTTARTENDGAITVLAASDQSRVWLEHSLAHIVKRTLTRLLRQDTDVHFEVEAASPLQE